MPLERCGRPWPHEREGPTIGWEGWSEADAKPEGDVPGSVSFTGILPSGVGAAPDNGQDQERCPVVAGHDKKIGKSAGFREKVVYLQAFHGMERNY